MGPPRLSGMSRARSTSGEALIRPVSKGAAVSPDAPMRLLDALKEAFPQGGMTVSGLRREAARGRLVIEKIAGKDFVTLAAIEQMRQLCRAQAKDPGSISNARGGMAAGSSGPAGSSATAD